GKFLVYVDENKKQHDVSLENNETQTEIFKHTVDTDGVAVDGKVSELLEVKDLKKGDIYYSYKTESGKINYINMTSDVINSVQNSEALKQEIFNTVNNYTTEGGNVYYGKIDTVDKEVLYTVDKDNNKTQIDISQDVLKVIESTVNNSIVEKILQQTEVKVITDSVDVAVNSSIDGSLVYRGKRKVTVKHDDGYDVTFIGSITAKPSDKKQVVEGGTRTVTYQDSTATMETLLSANIIDVKTKQVVVSTVTDVNVSGNELTFYFGQNGMYMALDNGEYEVVFEYTASK
ncbi:hypothetical protein HX052_10755, partial [Myroides marinus]|nr:hypothetical protein [Myroides marinus]MDM1404570.1 hypothetical protein [Myroides marinus]